MPFNINDFKENIASFGYLDNNSFDVIVQTPGILLGQASINSNQQIAKNMSFRIDQVRAPGISLITADINRYGLGPTQKQPHNAQFQEINLSILGDHFCEFWQFWYGWERAIFEFNGTQGGLSPSYTALYKEQYSSTVTIRIFDHYGNNVQRINLFQAFPTALREVPLSWGDSNLMKINVSIAYTEYTIERITAEKAKPASNPTAFRAPSPVVLNTESSPS